MLFLFLNLEFSAGKNSSDGTVSVVAASCELVLSGGV